MSNEHLDIGARASLKSRAGKPAEIPALTGLRGIAAYSVLIAHALGYSGVQWLPLTNLAYFAMSLFFALSGFVIQYNYGQSFAVDRAVATKRFLLARFARLYPLYFVGLILSVSYVPKGPFFTNPLVALSCLTLTQSWFNIHGAVGELLGASWSISTEFGLYLMFIPFGSTISRLRRPLVALVWLSSFAVIAVFVIVLAFPGYLSPFFERFQFLTSRETAPWWQWLLYVSPLMRAFEFFAGAMAARLVLSGSNKCIGSPATCSILANCCVLYCLAIILFGPPASIENVIGALMPNFIFAPAIVSVLIIVSSREVALGRLLSSRPMVAAGEISYSVYLLQSIAFISIQNSFVGLHFVGNVSRTIASILITTALSYGVYHLFEAPMRIRIRKLGNHNS